MLLKTKTSLTAKRLNVVIAVTYLLLPGCSQDQKRPEPEKDTALHAIEKGTMEMYPELVSFIEKAANDTAALPEERKTLLDEAAAYIRTRQADNEPARMIFICTHNSRRSHMSQLWAATMAVYTGKAGAVETYSGGTEATAFNPRALRAMEKAGFTYSVTAREEKDNPVYELQYGPESSRILCFSKKYDAPENPQAGFAAIMTCSQADEACPIVRGAAVRIPVTYEDPKAFDGTPRESEAYDERCRQIAAEMLYMMGRV